MTGVRRLVITSVLLVIAVAAAASPAGAAPGSPFTQSGQGPFLIAADDPADLGLTVTGSQDPVNVNESFNYTVSAANGGPDPASNVVITVVVSYQMTVGTLPSGCSVVDDQPNNKRTVTCTVPTMASGGSANFTFPVTPTVPGLYSAQGHVTSDTPDPVSGNDSYETFTNVLASGATDNDLELTITDSPDPVPVGQAFTITFTVTNHGPATNAGATVRWTPPGEVGDVSGDCDHVVESPSYDCHIGEIPVGGSAQAQMSMVAFDEGEVTNGAFTTSSTNSDTDYNNNGDEETTTVGNPRTLSVSKNGTGTGTVTSSPAGINCGSACSHAYPTGSVVTLTATPTGGGSFGGWGGACASAVGNTCTLTMTAARSASATFVKKPGKTLTVTTTGGTGRGSVTSSPPGINCPGDCTETFDHGTVVKLTGSPAGGAGFAGWGDDCEGYTGPTCTLTMDASKSALGAFTPTDTVPGLNIELARPFKSGKALVFTATMNGVPIDQLFGLPVIQLHWNFGNTTKTVVSTRPYIPPFFGFPQGFFGHLGPSVRVRPNLVGASSVRLTIVLPGGGVLQTRRAFFSSSFVKSHKPTDANALDIAAGLSKASAPSVFATGDPDVLTGRSSKCGPVSIQSSVSTIEGCFKPVDDLSDIPEKERGILWPVAIALKQNLFHAGIVDRMAELVDGYVAKGRVIINGRWPVDSHGSGRIVSYPQASALTSTNASLRLIRRNVYGPYAPTLSLKLNPKKTSFRPGAGLNLGLNSLGGFKVVPRDNSMLLLADRGLLSTSVTLPGFINKNGVPVRAGVELTIQPESANGDGMKIGPTNVRFGSVPINGFKIAYSETLNRWSGRGEACFLNITCLDLLPPYGGITIQNNSLVARTSRGFGSPGRPLMAGATLQRITAGVGLDPTRLFGSAKVAVGPLVTVDGTAALAFPSSRTPYFLRRDEVGNNFPNHLYSSAFTNPVVALGADATVHLPVVGDTKLGSGYLLYEFGGYGAFGGNSSIRILGVVRISGGVNAEVDGPKGLYNLHGDVSACLIPLPKVCGGAVSNVSRGPNNAGGAGACITVGPLHVGGGVQWAKPNKPFYWPFDGCKWSPFKLDVRSKIRAAAAGDYTVTVKAGQPSQAIQLSGQGGAPLVHVSGPGGQVLDSTPGGLDATADGKIRIMRIPGANANFTIVGLQNARPGTYTVSLLPGSVPVTQISRASDPLPAKVTGKLTGKGATRVLHYDVRKRLAQKVQFYDTAPSGAARAIGNVVVGGGRGTRSFTPSPGRGLHKIVARFELNGMPAEEKTVLRFKPPSPSLGRPGALRVTRAKNGALNVSWRRVAGATSYELVVTKSVGGQKALTTRKLRVTIGGVAKTVSGRVSVRGVATLREGAVAQKPFRRLALPKDGIVPLRHCTVKKRKATCR
jgi:hypothetical protein